MISRVPKGRLIDRSQPSIFSCFQYSIVERGERAASELDASAKQEAFSRFLES